MPRASVARSGMIAIDLRQRALLLWPRLDPVKLSRTRGRPMCIVRLVARRSTLEPETILGMLLERRPSPTGEVTR